MNRRRVPPALVSSFILHPSSLHPMTEVSNDLWSVFDARRVKAPELKGLDSMVNGMVGVVKNRRPVLGKLRAQAERIERLEPEVMKLGSTRFQGEVADCKALARRNKMVGPAL